MEREGMNEGTNGLPDVEANGPCGEAPADAAEAKAKAALEAMSTEDLRKELDRVLGDAKAAWERFEARFVKGKQQTPLGVARALAALQALTGGDVAQLWAEMGIAVQTARTTQRACLEMGAATARCIRALEAMMSSPPDAVWAPLDLGALDSALRWFESQPKPSDLPEGSVRTTPVLVQPQTESSASEG